MIKKINGILNWYESTLFQEFPALRHGSFTRHGGVSGGDFESLNVSTHVGDRDESVSQNRQRVIECLVGQETVPQLITPRATHSARVDSTKVITSFQDGLITNQPGEALLITHADCQAALFYDPINQVIGNIHSGWRGSAQNIYQNGIQAMRDNYGSKPEDIFVWISPSLGPEAAQFINYRVELPEPFWEFQVRAEYFNFWEISRSQLMQAGILAAHIEVSGLCTYSKPDEFFSYRREKRTGRLATVIWITQK